MTTSYLLNKCLCTLEKGWQGKQENKNMKTSSLLNKCLYTIGKAKEKNKKADTPQGQDENQRATNSQGNCLCPHEGNV